MTRLIPILFLLGSLWAPFAWVLVAGFFADEHWKIGHCISLAAFLGYWVWFGWGWHCLTGRFPLVSPRQFWTVSFVTHLIWFAVFFPRLSLNSLWITANLIVAFVGMLPESRASLLPDKLVRAGCYGFSAFMAVIALLGFSDFPGLAAFILLIAVVAIVITARVERTAVNQTAVEDLV